MKNLFFYLSFLLILSSCNDENVEIFLSPGRYQVKNYTVDNIRLINNTNEVTDAAMIHSFLDNYGIEGYFYLNNVLSAADRRFELIVRENNEVSVIFAGDTVECTIHERGDMLYFEMKDIVYYPPSYPVVNGIGTYHPLYSDTLDVPISTGYSYVLSEKTCFYASRYGQGVKMPVMSLAFYKSIDGDAQLYIFKDEPNDYNGKARDFISGQDILIFQQRYYVLDRLSE